MLANDSVTLPVEIPGFLARADFDYYRIHGFDLGFERAEVTGHIDFLQIRKRVFSHSGLQARVTERDSRTRSTYDLCAGTCAKGWFAAEVLQMRLVR